MMRFATLGGATVTVERDTACSAERYRWACAGCRKKDSGQVEQHARNDANNHAGQCRSLPPIQN
jgi:hypothetical protein